MLKPVDRGDDPDRPIGELVHQLAEEGKAYARAELDLAKAIALARAEAARVPAIMLGAALLVAQAAVLMLAFGLFSATYWYIGPVSAALLTALLFGGLAWLLVRSALKKLGAGK